MSFFACRISAPASRSFGTVSTSQATIAPRIDETIAVPIRSARPRKASLPPAEFADERDELRRAAVFDLHARPDASYARQPLISHGTDWQDHAPRSRHLLHERLRHFRRRRGDDDPIERRLIRP